MLCMSCYIQRVSRCDIEKWLLNFEFTKACELFINNYHVIKYSIIYIK